MTEKSYPYDGITVGDASISPYSADEWAYLWKLRHGMGTIFPNYGVLKGTGDGTYKPLGVYQTSVASTNVEVKIGAALIHGRLYETTVAVTLAIAANSSGNPRIDTVVLRLDNVAQTIRLVVKQGTPAGSPVAPSLSQIDGTIWEMPLANIAVANGFSTITDANITNRQRFTHSTPHGWLPYAHPLNYLIGANYDASTEPFSSNAAVAAPFHLTANMLLESLTVRLIASGTVTAIISWAIYFQDVNDGNSGENTLRQIAFSDIGLINVVGHSNNTYSATPAPVVLGPGLYWVIIKNSNFPALNFGQLPESAFDAGHAYLIHSNPTLGQTLNFVTGAWTRRTGSVPMRLNGRVFGQTSAF